MKSRKYTTVRLFKTCQPELELIREWMFENLGFMPNQRQIVEFTIHTTNAIPRVRIKRLALKTALFPGSSGRYYDVKVRTEIRAKLEKIHNGLDNLHTDLGVTLTALIMFRAATLPIVEKRSLDIKEKARRSFEKDFSPKFDSYLENISQTILDDLETRTN